MCNFPENVCIKLDEKRFRMDYFTLFSGRVCSHSWVIKDDERTLPRVIVHGPQQHHRSTKRNFFRSKIARLRANVATLSNYIAF